MAAERRRRSAPTSIPAPSLFSEESLDLLDFALVLA
jgi:hypothetical protein